MQGVRPLEVKCYILICDQHEKSLFFLYQCSFILIVISIKEKKLHSDVFKSRKIYLVLESVVLAVFLCAKMLPTARPFGPLWLLELGPLAIDPPSLFLLLGPLANFERPFLMSGSGPFHVT